MVVETQGGSVPPSRISIPLSKFSVLLQENENILVDSKASTGFKSNFCVYTYSRLPLVVMFDISLTDSPISKNILLFIACAILYR